ncbi:haloacid dehalogenase [Microtetraspora sp. NBRC 13810]|uniref:HAD-IA family hydrolase n=1 Tax=Microtetraspora sp. NBRC 13810 TaxID=3030990 RepID=UPI0024A05405|nr:HAD-IA family hydrolase [Microtetraspora sp. NBRC 13810]GLW11123.1 haloacid dehalogenase [Microtetraspora sp. NBRC 13810]
MTTHWTLLDYGEVISLPQQAGDIAAMAALAGQDDETFRDRYWRHRLPYDRGQADHLYWGEVLGRALAPDDPLVGELVTADVASWSRIDPAALRTIEEHVARGDRLALLSNAPEPLAAAVDRASWAAAFSHRFYSCRLSLTKPDPAIYETVLRLLQAEPANVVFHDDRAENVEAARALGINAVLHRAR